MKKWSIKNNYLEVNGITLGATITSLKLAGFNHNLTIGFEKLSDYPHNTYYLGSMVAPSAGRIANGVFAMDNQHYQLDIDRLHHLHGGETGLSHVEMDVHQTKEDAITFTKTIDHRPGGYPGIVDYVVQLVLKENTLHMTLKATPSVKMPLNMTNHMYFNLDGTDSITNHQLKINSEKVVALDVNGAPSQQLIDVEETVFDFREFKPIKQLFTGHPQFEISRGLDHPFVLMGQHELALKGNEVEMNLQTSADAIVCYSANYFDEGFITDQGILAKNTMALAIEPQNVPNGVNTGLEHEPFYTPDRPFISETSYTFKKAQ